MPEKFTFGGLGNLFKCVECGCSEFVRAENVKPARHFVYECVNCHEWYTPNNRVHVDAAIQPPAEADSSLDIIPANVAGSQPRQ